MNNIKEDNSMKSILARGCDPVMSLQAAKDIPPLIGHPEYMPTTNDVDFVDQLKSRKWSVVFFAPGACRFSAAAQTIPGGSMDTKGWSLSQYRELVYELQGPNVKIVETPYEHETLDLLQEALQSVSATN